MDAEREIKLQGKRPITVVDPQRRERRSRDDIAIKSAAHCKIGRLSPYCLKSMTTIWEPKVKPDPGTSLRVPATETDQTTSAERPSLARAVQRAVRVTDEQSLRRVARCDAGFAFQPRTLLAITSYCYARGILGSLEIEDVMRRDAQFRQSCQNEFPGARLIQCFRRENRAAICACLREALRFLNGQSPDAAGDEARLAEEAERLVLRAMFIDRMEWNEG